jgi:predicted enzyme related to lactoylglutathione lyase
MDWFPSWWLNLLREPRATIQIGRTRRPILARQATPDERDRLWTELTLIAPGYLRYEARTSRAIPLGILQPADSSSATGGRRIEPEFPVRSAAMPPVLIEFPADDTERARRFWQGLLQTTLASRDPEQGSGWQNEREGIVFGLHERGSGPGDRFSLPYFPVTDLPAAVARVRELGGEIVHPSERWVICRDSEGTPFGLAGPP